MPLSIEGERTAFGDVGTVGGNPNLGNRSHVFQVGGKGNSASSNAESGVAGSSKADPLNIGQSLPVVIVGGAVLLAAALLFK